VPESDASKPHSTLYSAEALHTAVSRIENALSTLYNYTSDQGLSGGRSQVYDDTTSEIEYLRGLEEEFSYLEEQFEALRSAAQDALADLEGVGDAVDVSDLWPKWDRAYRALAVALSDERFPAGNPDD